MGPTSYIKTSVSAQKTTLFRKTTDAPWVIEPQSVTGVFLARYIKQKKKKHALPPPEKLLLPLSCYPAMLFNHHSTCTQKKTVELAQYGNYTIPTFFFQKKKQKKTYNRQAHPTPTSHSPTPQFPPSTFHHFFFETFFDRFFSSPSSLHYKLCKQRWMQPSSHDSSTHSGNLEGRDEVGGEVRC